MKPYFDAVIVTPLSEEFESALLHFKFEEDISTGAEVRFRVSIENCELRLLLVRQPAMGRAGSQSALLNALNDYEIGMAICLGIAGVLSNDLKIGDICYSKSIVDVLDNAKIVDGGKTESEITFSPTYYSTPVEIVTAIARNKLNPVYKERFLAWSEACFSHGKILIPATFVGKQKKEEQLETPSVFEGLIACGDVCASAAYRKKLQGLDRKVLAIETESGGLFYAAQLRQIPALTVRGISDYADVDKTVFEEQTAGNARVVAAFNAASFLKHQLSSELMRAWFAQRLAQRSAATEQISLLAPPPRDAVGDAIANLSKSFDDKLRELEPSYSLQTKGYRIPVPRIRLLDDRSATDEPQDWSDPIEIREAIREARAIVLTVPKDYPDHSLSWIVANELLAAQRNDKQVLSVVIESKLLRRPKPGFNEQLPSFVRDLRDSPEVQLLFVIDEFRFDSRTRTAFLLEQINLFPNACFIVVTRDKANVLVESEFAASAGAKIAHIDSISFVEISHFIQKNFAMPAPASEVAATRLRETFSRYELAAHPSYFAGIPRDTLAALLDANRRGELIQLAVAGYLSFVVANDEASVVLSRTTREHFLAELSIALNVEKRNLTEVELAAYVQEMSSKFDYGVSPVSFVNSFVTKGILHFDDGGHVRFTLPFIESYLLAKRLHEQPALARKYFMLPDSDFDLPTFALYSELGASPEFIDHVAAALTAATDELAKEVNEPNILLSSALSPVMLRKPERLKAIQKRLNKAVTDVRSDRDQSQEKQRLLDASDRIKERAAQKSEAKDASKVKEHTFDALNRAMNVWIVGANLLGSGVERIPASAKRDLISRVVHLAGLIIDRWTRVHQSVDFAVLKSEMMGDADFVASLAKSDSEEHVAEAKTVIDSLVDLLEYVWIAQPFRRMIETLCEEAREKVLAESLRNAKIDGEPDRLIHSIWLADIDPKTGRQSLLKSIKELPDSMFLRVVIASHLMTRVFWKHWKADDRLVLLEAANETLKAVGKTYDKSAIGRQIARPRASKKRPKRARKLLQ